MNHERQRLWAPLESTTPELGQGRHFSFLPLCAFSCVTRILFLTAAPPLPPTLPAPSETSTALSDVFLLFFPSLQRELQWKIARGQPVTTCYRFLPLSIAFWVWGMIFMQFFLNQSVLYLKKKRPMWPLCSSCQQQVLEQMPFMAPSSQFCLWVHVDRSVAWACLVL